MRRIVILLLFLAISVAVGLAQTKPPAPGAGTPELIPTFGDTAPADVSALFQAMDNLAGSRQRMRLYDDFNTMIIDPAKWGGRYPTDWLFCNNPLTRECGRILENGSLRLAVRTYGSNDSDTGTSQDISYVNFLNPSTVTTITLRAVITKSQGLGCSNNPDGGLYNQLLILGRFFNIGAGSNPTEDVYAWIILFGPPDDQNLGWAGAGLAGALNSWDNFGPVKLVGEETVMSLRWDGGNHRFLAGLKQQRTPPQVLILNYSEPDIVPAAIPWKQIAVPVSVGNCTGERTFSGVEAKIREVLVNASALP